MELLNLQEREAMKFQRAVKLRVRSVKDPTIILSVEKTESDNQEHSSVGLASPLSSRGMRMYFCAAIGNDASYIVLNIKWTTPQDTNWQIERATEALAVRSAVNLVWNNSDNSRRGGEGVHIGGLKGPRVAAIS